jgi:T-complex protein 1 subunit beta
MSFSKSGLSLVTGDEIASTFKRPDLVKLGHCDLIEETLIGDVRVCGIDSVCVSILKHF